ncbi:MAG: hypothetical protein IT374_15430 [Polyangiaceae bacterium]|nr:hypothetical protein [Polyangiaceae bacterium]
MTSRFALVRASLIALATPLAACGGSTTDGTTGGQAGGAQGGNGQAGGAQGGSSQGGSAGKGATSKHPCLDPVAILVDGKDTGFDTCAAGELRRREAKTCPSLLPRATTCTSGGGVDSCKSDSDCKEKPNGHCDSGTGFEAPGCRCDYGCTSDADCGADAVCLCGSPVGRCVPSKCKDASSCPEGDCTSYDASPGCSFTAFACQSAGDTCGGDKDCAGTNATLCAYPQGAGGAPGVRSCQQPGCAIGRPLVVDDAVLRAPLVSGAAWT